VLSGDVSLRMADGSAARRRQHAAQVGFARWCRLARPGRGGPRGARRLAGVLEAAGPIRRVLGPMWPAPRWRRGWPGSCRPGWRPSGSRRRRRPLHNRYLDPARLGADRWAALVGARALTARRRWW
jgi:hypothetical protein